MKSRTLYFKMTIFRKDMTRFAPAWGLYLICLLLGMLLLRSDNGAYWFHQNLAELTTIMSIINLGYALLAAQLIFGDLYNSRMCGYVHALPVTRESLFGSHVAAGMAWSVGPTAVAALLAMVLGIGSQVSQGWQIALWWLLGTNLQYLFFFGVAAFSALCVGNRFAQAVIYGIINFASVIVYWLVDTLYTPMLYGVTTNEDSFLRLSPVTQFASSEYLSVSRDWDHFSGETTRAWYEMSDGWGYLAICAVLGAALLVCACLLYRRRQLECAGDFMAVKALEPVFLVVYPLIVAAVLYFVCDEMLYVGGIALLYMGVGLVIGYFTGEMLLQGTTKVFRKRTFVKFAALAVGFGLTIGITALDPFGIETWIPDQEDVTAVEICPYYGYSSYYSVLLEEPDEIEDALRVHEIALEERSYDVAGYYTVEQASGEEVYVNTQSISIRYHLKSGAVRTRSYTVNISEEAGQLLIPYFSSFDAIFRDYDGDRSFENILKVTQTIGVSIYRYDGGNEKTAYDVDGYYVTITDREMIRELLEAMAADAELGVMAQNWDFRPDPGVGSSYWMDFDMGNQNANVSIYTDCVNTNTWLTEHGFISQAVEELGGVTAYYETK